MPVILRTALLLLASNIFMTFAWYAHLRNLHERSWYVAALASWGIALFEYLLQVPANRIGYTQLSVAQLKITQEVRDFAAKQNQPSDQFLAAEDAEAGMAEMSEAFKNKGSEIYLPASE